jgi:hypothetical protein
MVALYAENHTSIHYIILEGKTMTEAEEKRYSQRKKKDFCEAMRVA